ncbi:hypothetical protein FOZ61_001961 [Perkinsus olseni]|uniref:Spen paralogue and orthologue SPOC C-terminal domain-containing protein n=1 Tax=Perkinsus olseni TaxID=32597 RepID=A0A7J6LUV6_PEROL|nr:hypothetical protein FOZ61_001961 [Perkinsus olseni]
MSHPGNPSAGDGGGGSGCPPHATAAPTIENYMRGSDWRGKWRKAATPVHIEPRKPFASHSQHGGIAAERPNSGGPVIIDWRKSAAPGTTPPKRPRPWSGEPQWHSNHAKGHHVKGHHHQGPWEGDWHQQQQQQQQRDPGWNEGGEPWQGDRNWEGGRWWNWKANPAGPGGTWHEDSGSKEQQWSANDGWNQQDQYHRGSQGSWGGEGPWEEGKWQAADQQQQQPVEQQGGAPPLGGDVKTQHDASQEQGSEEPSTKKARGASKSPDGQPGSTIFVNALRKLFQAKNAAAAKAPAKTATNTDNNNPALWEEGKAPEKPLGGGALTALLSKQATLSAAKAPSPVPSPGSPSNGQSDTELRKNVLTRLLASENAGDLLQDPKVVEMLLQVASQLDESGLSDLQKSVVKIITKLQSSSSPTAAATTLPPDQLAKRGACVERLKAILEGLRGLFLERQEKRISQASKTAAATAKLSSSTPSHSHLASLLSGVSAQNQPIYDHKVWTGHVQRSGVNKAKVNLYATLPVNSLTTALVAQLGNELNLKLRVPDTEVLHQRQNHAESSALVLMKADSAADQAELNAQIAYFNGRSRSGVAKFERDGEHYAVFMIPPGQLAEKLIGSDNYKRCNPDDMATVCMITKSDTSTATH